MIIECAPSLENGILPSVVQRKNRGYCLGGVTLTPTLYDLAPVSSVRKKGWLCVSDNLEKGLIRKVVKYSILNSVPWIFILLPEGLHRVSQPQHY